MRTEGYYPADPSFWEGRTDSDTDFDAFRWHQWVQLVDLRDRSFVPPPDTLGILFIGFCCDEGVRRNRGRTGAAKGPLSIRKELANLPCWFTQDVKLYDAGNILCEDASLETAQSVLADLVTRTLELGLFPIVLGGGHEIALGHYRGIQNYLIQENPRPALGIINFDAHLDLRPYDGTGSSGTMFRQIADDCLASGQAYAYLCIGAQKYANTVALFKTAEALGADYILSKDLAEEIPWKALEVIESHLKQNDGIYLTICADVFSSAFAPGVSATQPLGLEPELVLKLLKLIFRSGKVRGFDIAEVAPRFDQDSTTANLAKVLIFSAVNALAHLRKFNR